MLSMSFAATISQLPVRLCATLLALGVALATPTGASAEVSQLRISRGFGAHFLPLYVMEAKGLLQKRAAADGLGDIKIEFLLVDGGNHINDAILAGSVDIAATGTGGFLTLWAKTKGNPNLEVVGLGGSASGGMTMTSRNPAMKSLRDVTDKDRIAVPGIKTSLGAIILQMAVAKEFGDKDYARLDHLTVSMSYPDAVAAMLSGKAEITAHVASAPFSYMELDHPGIHKVFNSVDLFGHVTTIMALPPTSPRPHRSMRAPPE
jgi:NitT/TauT family transport system substrate-binding protein